jgi:rubrerythrin
MTVKLIIWLCNVCKHEHKAPEGEKSERCPNCSAPSTELRRVTP